MESSYPCPVAQCDESIDVLQVLLNIDPKEDIQATPSKFMAEMKLSTEERFEKLRKARSTESNFDTYDVSPDIVIFQNFERGVVYSTSLSLRNTHNVSRPLRAIFEDSPYFSVSYASESISTHIAPGMSIHFNIKFCAEDAKDHRYHIKFATEGEHFVVPIIAISPRPLLDFPDYVNLPNCAVKVGSKSTVLIRNLGRVSAIFSLNTKAPFSVSPEKGVLLPDQSMQLEIDFMPQKLGLLEDSLVVSYETGEKICIDLRGHATNSDITIEKGSLLFQQTYMGLTRQRNIKLTNKSNHIVQFQWKLYRSNVEDQIEAEKIKCSLNFLKEHEKIKSNTLETFNIIDGYGHSKIYNRIYEDEIQEFDNNNQFLFNDSYFEIIPVTGEVWPGGTFDFTIIFSPTTVSAYTSCAYLDVSGRVERLKLLMHGEGIGPYIEFNLECLDANQIYMRAVHQYEIAAINKGDIPGEIRYKPRDPEFGGEVSCWPSKLHLKPNECGNFVFQFSSRTQGSFFEEIHFEIKHSRETKRIIIMFAHDVVLISHNLKDTSEMITALKDSSEHAGLKMNVEKTKIMTNLVMSNNLNIGGDVIEQVHAYKYLGQEIKIGRANQAHEIRGEIICPLLSFEISEVDFGAVPLGYPVRQPVVLHNPAMVPIDFEVFVDNDGEIAATTCEEYAILPMKCGLAKKPREFDFSPRTGAVPANSSLCVELTLIANIVRHHSTIFTANLWGSDKYSISLPVKYKACVPHITSVPAEVNIRFCFVEYPYNRTIIIRNDSQFSGFFQVLPQQDSVQGGITFSSTVTEGFLKPYGEAEVHIVIMTTYLGEDRVPFNIQLFGSTPMHCCTIVCNGQGPVITIQPEKMNFGNVTLLETSTREIAVCNDSPIAADVHIRISSKSLFIIEPRDFILQPEETRILIVTLYLANPYSYREKLFIDVVNGNTIMCPLAAKGVGTSILCEPKIHPHLNIGTILTYQKFSLEVRLTNKGFRAHKILWSRNPHLKQLKDDSEYALPTVFTITPTELDLAYNESAIAHIEGYTTKCGSIEEDFYCHAVIEKSKKQTVIISLTITARFVEPSVEISKKELNFWQNVGPDSVTEFTEDEISIINKSNLTLEIEIFLKRPFYLSFYLEQPNFYHVVLQHEEKVDLIVAFDTCIREKRCIVWHEQLVLSYNNHPKVDKIKLIGKINFPHVEITPNFIRLPCLPANTSEYYEVTLKNISPLPVTYHFEWQEEECFIENIETRELMLPRHHSDSSFSRESSDSGIYLNELETKKANTRKDQNELDLSKNLDSRETLMNVDELDLDIHIEPCLSCLPIEHYSQRSYTEKKQSYHYTQIQDVIKVPVYVKDKLIFPERNQEYMTAICTLLYGSLVHFDEFEYEADVIKTLPRQRTLQSDIDQVVDLTPISGFLNPYETQLLSVICHPAPNMSISIHAQCHVVGGVSENLDITSKASNLSYSIERVFVDFGRNVFCTRSERTITITNTGHLDFEFMNSTKEFPDPISSEFMLEAGCLTVTPKYGVLVPGMSKELLIQYFPGIAGEFNETFEIKIGYLPAVTITVHGYGVFPQAYLYLPRPSFAILSPYVTYLAVASLTPDYLKSLENVKNIMHYDGVTVYEEDIAKGARDLLKRDGWIIISYNDLYPSVMDIDLAIERIILYQHIFSNPTVLSEHIKMHRAIIVPNFMIPSYLVDFGYVIVDTTVHYTIIILNYGPVPADVKVVVPGTGKKSAFESAGLALQFYRSVIRVGDTKELFISFHPTFEVYPELDFEVDHPFYLDVGHGPRIPINVRAIVTVPTVSSNLTSLDFGEVKCGDCMKRSLILTNKGHVWCEWHAIITKHERRRNTTIAKKPKGIFFLKESNGDLKIGSSCLLDVYFEPQVEGNVTWSLILTTDQNPEELIITLVGLGLKPTLRITEDKLEFGPVLPYVYKCEKYFTIQNMSSFPIEFYLSDFDFEIDEEERVLNLLMQYYNIKDMYIPLRAAGQKLPQALIDFYLKIVDSLREKLLKAERERILDESQNIKSVESLTKQHGGGKKSSSRKKLPSKSKSLVHYALAESVEFADPLSSMETKDMEILLKEHLAELIRDTNLKDTNSMNELATDPVSAAILEATAPPEIDPTALKDGVFIIFHGAPTTHLKEAANKAGLEVRLPVYSIDRLFFESLVDNASSATITVNEFISKEFQEVASEIDLIKGEGEDSYDELQKKINLLLSGKEKKPKPKPEKVGKGKDSKGGKKDSSKSSSKKESKKASSKGSKKKEKGKKADTRPTFMGISEDLLFEILKQRLSLFRTGVVIESLGSIFLRQPFLALNHLLRAIGNVKYIHCIILSYTYADNLIAEKTLKEKQEKQIINEREALLSRILKMAPDEFAKLSAEEAAAFKEFTIQQRKLNALNKREALKQRLLEAKLRKKLTVGKTAKNTQKQTTPGVIGDSAKSKKSDPSKGEKKSSNKSKGSSKGKAKLSPEEAEKKRTFDAFETDVQNMLHFLEFWDRKILMCTKPLPVLKGGKGKGSAGKKQSKSSKGSNKPSKKNLNESTVVDVLQTPKEVVPLSPEEELKLLETGIPCWLLNNAHRDKPVEAIVANYLNYTPELQKATEALEESFKEHFQEFIEFYSVLHKVKESRVKNTSDVYIIKDAEFLNVLSIDAVANLEGKENSYELATHSPATSFESSPRKGVDSKASILSKTKRRKHTKEKAKSSKHSIISGHSLKRSPSSPTPDKISERSALDIELSLTPRAVLNPGDAIKYRVIFKPESCGYYEHTFTIEMKGWSKKYSLTCQGRCDIPRVDMTPKKIFTKVAKRQSKKNMFCNNIFFKELDLFDFGPALMNDVDNLRLLAVTTEFNFTNCSLLPCEISFFLRDDSDAYEFSPDVITVEPDTTEALSISAIPTMIEDIENQLVISIKGNPKIETINLASEGCKFKFNITPNLIHFDRVLINHIKTQSIFLENESLIPVNWKFVEPENVLEYFKVSELAGYIQAKDTQEVVVEYVSEISEDVPTQALEIVIHDQDFKSDSPLLSDFIEISAEATEINIECLKGIEIGEVKGKFLHLIVYTMLNKGKYPADFAFTEVLEDEDAAYEKHAHIRSYFKMAPVSGVLQPNKQFVAKLTFFSKKVADFKNVPILTCTFTECLYKTVIETFQLTASAKTFLAGFELCPPEVIKFGSQLIGTEKVQEMTLKNDGKFEFSYSVVSLRKLLEQKAKKTKDTKGKKGKKESKSSKSTKSKESKKSDKANKSSKKSKASSKSDTKKKPKPTKLDAGVFSVISSTGIVEPNERVTIQVFSRPKLVGTYEETIIFYISECRPSDSKGRYVNLSVIGCIPSINFSDYDGIFREQYVVNRIADFKPPEVVGAHCVFIKEEVRLHFSQVMLNREATARIRLENIGSIPADVIVKVSSVSENVFSVKPDRFNVDTYSTNYTTISFIPTGINTFQGMVEIGYEYPAGLTANNFQIKLSGEGLVPEIALRHPEFDHALGCYSINFNPTVAGSTSFHKISFENIGIVPCQVIIEVCEGATDMFTLIPHSDTTPFLKIVEQAIKSTAHTNIVNLNPNQMGEFDVSFKPSAEGQFNCVVKLHIVDNPFETFMIFVTSMGYVEDIIIKGLSTCAIKNANSDEALIFTNHGYELDFGYPFINVLQKKSFKIVNNSLSAIYKFEFAVSDKLLFIPAIGHLKPNATKEVIATFLSKEPIHILKEVIECIIYQIQYINPELEPLSWDERQNVSIWEPVENVLTRSPRSSIISNISNASDYSKNSSPSRITEREIELLGCSELSIKTITEKAEPLIVIISTTSKCIPILFTVMCDYSSYECSGEVIDITDTLAFEKRSQTFQVTNTSNVVLDLCWKISMDESYPIRINSETLHNNLSGLKNELSDGKLKCDSQILSDKIYSRSGNFRPRHLTGAEKFISEELSQPSTSQSSLFSVEANLSDRSNDSWMEGDFIPFTITPGVASIQPKEDKTFTITFTPKDVFNYLVHLRSEISNLHPSLKHLDIIVKARSLLPLCHFDVGSSDYLSVRRKGQRMCRDIADENTTIVEFEAVGLGVSNTRSFNIINPTGESYSYKWMSADINGKDISLFHCHKPNGFVEKGKTDEAVFSFLPQTVGTFEAFYIIHIERHSLSRTFLLVGVAREPDIRFSSPHVDIRSTVIGVDATECVALKNNENLEIDFRFKKESLYSEARLQALIVEPLKGILLPYGEQQIKITLHSTKKGEVNFNLKCVVEKIKRPLLLSVTANCLTIQPRVFYDSEHGAKVILDSEKINTIELKSMIPHLRQQITFTIANTGDAGFYYFWTIKYDLISNKVKIGFKDVEGYVASKATIASVMNVTPLAKVVVKKLKIKLQIRYGPTYQIQLMGSAEHSPFTFSVDEYNFGPCLVQKEATSFYKKVVEFTNNDQVPVTLECKIPTQNHLSINFKSKLIQPKKSEPLLIIFNPREIQHYYTEIEFYINSKLHVLKIYGEGVRNSIELKDIRDKFLDLGCVLIGETATKRVQVVNNGVASVDIIFDLNDRLPYFSRPQKKLEPEFEREEKPLLKKVTTSTDQKGKKEKKGKKDSKKGSKGDKSSKKASDKSSKKDSKGDKGSKKGSKASKKGSKADKDGKEGKKEKKKPPGEIKIQEPIETAEMKEQRLILEFIKFAPKNFTTVAPQQSVEFVIKFTPTERMKYFNQMVSYQVQDIIETLCIFKGCCVGPDYTLDNNYIAFGNVIHGCLSEKKVVLHNIGDIGGKFNWNFEKLQPNFTITPKEGYISPDTTVTFVVKYEPQHISCLLEAKAKCQVDGFTQSLELTLAGSCFNKPPPKELIKFSCPVRESDRKNITIHNPTGQVWKITPTIKGQYFSTQEIFVVNQKASGTCEIIYKPLSMSGEIPHEASIFFNLAEGQGIVYSLIGAAIPPKPVEVISKQITCKTYHNETLNVANWLSIPQKFTVTTESLTAAGPPNKTLYKLTGNDTIDVLAQSQRDYTWTIYVLNEGMLKFKVIFKNEATQEYLFYEIVLTVTKCPPLDVIKLTTCVRIPVIHTLKLQNPIKTPVVFNIRCTSTELAFQNMVTVPPYSEHDLKIEYNPITLGESKTDVGISSNELGLYPYDFVLTAHPPIPEPYVCFTANLGQAVSQKAFIINPTSSLVDFASQVEHPEIFYLENFVAVEPKQKGAFDVYFEPNRIGNVQSTLTLSSPITGMYIYPLIGTCNLPKPQGPYCIKAGGNITILFKNPFDEAKTFNCAIEPAIFSLKSASEVVKARKDAKIVASLLPLKNLEILIDQKYPITGKLVIYCNEPELCYIKWIYYLQGDLSN